MSDLTDEEFRVARHYDEGAFEYELDRLPRDSPAEYAITKRWLERLIPPGALVAEVGVGGGFYSEFLARRGCSLHLIDISARLLDHVQARLASAGLSPQVLGAHLASAADLAQLPSASLDAVLLLGPLYHLHPGSERRRAVAEAARLLKPSGILFAAGINRLAYLRDQFRTEPASVSQLVDFHAQYLRDGNLDPLHAPPIGYAHLTTVTEFPSLFEPAFERVAFLGSESFLAAWQHSLNALSPADAELWIDLVEATAQSPEGLGQSDHLLYIGRKPSA
jgi:S-adenosylmethionine-dependent methyltransferase